MMEDNFRINDLSTSDSDSSDEQRAPCVTSQLLQENRALKERAERLHILMEDIPEFEEERLEMLEDLRQSHAREQELERSLKEEDEEHDRIRDALEDLRFLKTDKELRRSRLIDLKKAVFKAECVADEQQFELKQKELLIQRQTAEIDELLALEKNCILHLEETKVRVQETERKLRDTQHWRPRQRVAHKRRRKKTHPPPVKTVRHEKPYTSAGDTIVQACCFCARLYLMLNVIFSVALPLLFSRAPSAHMAGSLCILESGKEFIIPFIATHYTMPPLY